MVYVYLSDMKLKGINICQYDINIFCAFDIMSLLLSTYIYIGMQ